LLDELSDLVGHKSSSRLKEGLCLIFIEVLKLLSEDVYGALVPVGAEKSLDLGALSFLSTEEVHQRDWILSWLWDVYKVVGVVVLPEFHELQSSLRADAKVLAHQHSCHHDVVFPLFVWFNSLIEI
jgi:hypothetical protein